MDKTNYEKPFHVAIIESERDWGQRTDEVRGFDTPEEANSFIKEYNKQNDKDTVPDWYMYARALNY